MPTSNPVTGSRVRSAKFGRSEAALLAAWLGALALAAAVSFWGQVRLSITLGVATGVGLALYGGYLRRAAPAALLAFNTEATDESPATWRIANQLASLLFLALALVVTAASLAEAQWWWVGILGYVAITVLLSVVSSRRIQRTG